MNDKDEMHAADRKSLVAEMKLNNERYLKVDLLFKNPEVYAKAKAALELEKSKKGTGKKPFTDACKEVIDDAKLIESIWDAVWSLPKGYCW